MIADTRQSVRKAGLDGGDVLRGDPGDQSLGRELPVGAVHPPWEETAGEFDEFEEVS